MIDIDKVRLWSVRFVRTPELKYMPYPGMIVEEVEEPGYCVPEVPHSLIPLSLGGQLTLTLSGHGIFQLGNRQYDCMPGTAILIYDRNPLFSCRCPKEGHENWHFIWISFPGEASSRIIGEINRAYGSHFFLGARSELEKTLLSYRKYAGATFSQTPQDAAGMVFDIFKMLLRSRETNLRRPRDITEAAPAPTCFRRCNIAAAKNLRRLLLLHQTAFDFPDLSLGIDGEAVEDFARFVKTGNGDGIVGKLQLHAAEIGTAAPGTVVHHRDKGKARNDIQLFGVREHHLPAVRRGTAVEVCMSCKP